MITNANPSSMTIGDRLSPGTSSEKLTDRPSSSQALMYPSGSSPSRLGHRSRSPPRFYPYKNNHTTTENNIHATGIKNDPSMDSYGYGNRSQLLASQSNFQSTQRPPLLKANPVEDGMNIAPNKVNILPTSNSETTASKNLKLWDAKKLEKQQKDQSRREKKEEIKRKKKEESKQRKEEKEKRKQFQNFQAENDKKQIEKNRLLFKQEQEGLKQQNHMSNMVTSQPPHPPQSLAQPPQSHSQPPLQQQQPPHGIPPRGPLPGTPRHHSHLPPPPHSSHQPYASIPQHHHQQQPPPHYSSQVQYAPSQPVYQQLPYNDDRRNAMPPHASIQRHPSSQNATQHQQPNPYQPRRY
eukprot:Awhi_evm1s2880